MSDYPPGLTKDEMIRGGLLDNPDLGPWTEQLTYTELDPDDPEYVITANDPDGEEVIIYLKFRRELGGGEYDEEEVEVYLADVLFVPGGCWKSGKPTGILSARTGFSYKARWKVAQSDRFVLTYLKAGKDCDYLVKFRAVRRG